MNNVVNNNVSEPARCKCNLFGTTNNVGMLGVFKSNNKDFENCLLDKRAVV